MGGNISLYWEEYTHLLICTSSEYTGVCSFLFFHGFTNTEPKQKIRPLLVTRYQVLLLLTTAVSRTE